MALFVAMALPALPAVAEEPVAASSEEPAGIDPEFVRPLVPVARGRNDSNPVWSPSGDMVALERSRGDNKEIAIVRANGDIVQTIRQQSAVAPGQSRFFFPEVVEETSYNSGISWSPEGKRFVFMSNGGEGNYDLYLREPDSRITRITTHKEKDGHANWSPARDQIAFISGRSGKGDVYLLDLATKATTRLTHGELPYLYPQWSPDGKRLAVIRGINENHDIYILEPGHVPPVPPKPVSTWRYDDLRPVWSPDGKRLAFYTNYNPADDAKTWAIVVVAADGSDPTEGEGLAARVVATDVIPDVERGPAWMPDNRRIVYVHNERQAYNPIYVVDVDSRTSTLVRTGTKMNHDVTCSVSGVIAFRAQVDQWDQVYLAKLKGLTP